MLNAYVFLSITSTYTICFSFQTSIYRDIFYSMPNRGKKPVSTARGGVLRDERLVLVERRLRQRVVSGRNEGYASSPYALSSHAQQQPSFSEPRAISVKHLPPIDWELAETVARVRAEMILNETPENLQRLEAEAAERASFANILASVSGNRIRQQHTAPTSNTISSRTTPSLQQTASMNEQRTEPSSTSFAAPSCQSTQTELRNQSCATQTAEEQQLPRDSNVAIPLPWPLPWNAMDVEQQPQQSQQTEDEAENASAISEPWNLFQRHDYSYADQGFGDRTFDPAAQEAEAERQVQKLRAELLERKRQDHRRASSLLRLVDRFLAMARGRATPDGPLLRALDLCPCYASTALRVHTFQFRSWPRHLKDLALSLVDAGFFYRGVDDLVTCYSCYGSLRCWKPYSNPWVQHALAFPRCLHVLRVRGRSFPCTEWTVRRNSA